MWALHYTSHLGSGVLDIIALISILKIVLKIKKTAREIKSKF